MKERIINHNHSQTTGAKHKRQRKGIRPNSLFSTIISLVGNPEETDNCVCVLEQRNPKQGSVTRPSCLSWWCKYKRHDCSLRIQTIGSSLSNLVHMLASRSFTGGPALLASRGHLVSSLIRHLQKTNEEVAAH